MTTDAEDGGPCEDAVCVESDIKTQRCAPCVHTAAFWMYVENRRAVGIGRIELLRSKVDPRGIRTEEISNEESFAWMAMASDKQKQTIGPVVNAVGRFGVGQFMWKPTKEDARELCRAINERAGTELLTPTGRT